MQCRIVSFTAFSIAHRVHTQGRSKQSSGDQKNAICSNHALVSSQAHPSVHRVQGVRAWRSSVRAREAVHHKDWWLCAAWSRRAGPECQLTISMGVPENRLANTHTLFLITRESFSPGAGWWTWQSFALPSFWSPTGTFSDRAFAQQSCYALC